VGVPTDQARVCLAAPPPAFTTLPVLPSSLDNQGRCVPHDAAARTGHSVQVQRRRVITTLETGHGELVLSAVHLQNALLVIIRYGTLIL
jgi:hypothetical protein